MKLKLNAFTWLTVLLAGLNFIYIASKAYHYSMSTDEAYTVMKLLPQGFMSFFTDMNTWETANNHLLNTLLTKLSTAIFGHAEWACRLPNVLAYLVFVFYVWEISKRLAKNQPEFYLLFVLLQANIYFNDFFSLCRGYGLSHAFMMAAIYHALRFVQEKRMAQVVCMSLVCVLATYANFTAIHFSLGLYVSVLLMLIMQEERANYVLYFKSLFIAGAIYLLCMLPILPIIKTLSEKGEFLYGETSLYNTILQYVQNASYGICNDHPALAPYLVGILLGILVLGVFWLVLSFRKSERIRFFMLSQFYVLLALMLFLHFSMNSSYLSERKAIIFSPALGFVMFYLVSAIRHIVIQKAVILVVSTMMLLHFVQKASVHFTYQWWYDTNVKNAVHDIKKLSRQGKDSLRLACHPWFHSSLQYYQQYASDHRFSLQDFRPFIDTSMNYDCFVVFDSERALLERHQYKLYKSYQGLLLMYKP